MSNDDIAAAVLECVGGFGNVADNSLCATRLRISLKDPERVNRNALHSINGVLGIADRGTSGIEVVFGPNLVRGVYRSFERLTGIISEPHSSKTVTLRPARNFQVRITPETPGAPQVVGLDMRADTENVSISPVDDDTNALLDLLGNDSEDTEHSFGALMGLSDSDGSDDGADEEEADDASYDEAADGPHLLVINGPNVNLLGTGNGPSPDGADFSDLLTKCQESATEAGFASCDCYQSNHEGDLIDRIQDAAGIEDAIVINAGGFAYTSVALLDAIVMVGLPTIEVQLERAIYGEGLPWQSYVGRGCLATITGQGIEGYRSAIFRLANCLGLHRQ